MAIQTFTGALLGTATVAGVPWWGTAGRITQVGLSVVGKVTADARFTHGTVEVLANEDPSASISRVTQSLAEVLFTYPPAEARITEGFVEVLWGKLVQPIDPFPHVFSFPCDWPFGFDEERAYTTSIFEGNDGYEQRRGLRSIASRRWSFTVTALERTETQLLESLLFSDADVDWTVPFWPHYTPLTSPITPGSVTMACDTIARDFVVGGPVMVWHSVTLFDVRTIASLTDTSITVTAPWGATWGAGDAVWPCRVGALVDDYTMERSFNTIRTRLTFRMRVGTTTEAGVADAPATAMTVGVLPDGLGRQDASHRNVTVFETSTSGFVHQAKELGRRYSFTYSTLLETNLAVRSAWDWYNLRVGSLNPSYVPSYAEDFTLVAAVAPADTTLSVAECGYLASYFDIPRKRWVALIPSPGTVQVRQILGSAPSGGTEVLTLATTAGVTLTTSAGLVCFARYARLDGDAITMRWFLPGRAQVEFPFIEIADSRNYGAAWAPDDGVGEPPPPPPPPPPPSTGDWIATGYGDSTGYADLFTGVGGGSWIAIGNGDSAGYADLAI